MEVVLSTTARKKLDALLEYLERKWSLRIKNEFIEKLDRSVATIEMYPDSFPASAKNKKVYKCVVTKQTVLFYKKTNTEIEVITLFDSRMDPKKLKI